MGQTEQDNLERLQVPDVGEILDGRYRVQGVIASGGMGVILRAEQLPMERPVALKLLHPHIAIADPNLVERFTREVRLAKQLNHPNTIRLYDFGKTKRGLVYVAMELLDGMNLKRRIAREGTMSAGRALEITRQMLDGLAEAHARGFIHRDLKPSNVFIVKNRRGEDLVKLLDFGIAKSLSDSAELTGSGSICGTPSYVAPEYLMQERPGKPADIYAVGLILLEMLTGRQVFKGEAPLQTMMMHLKLEPEIPDEIAQTPLKEVIERATVKDPRQRYGDAEEMYDAVCKVMRQVPQNLIVRRPEPDVLPKVTEQVGIDLDSAERERAAVDTIVPEIASGFDSSDELALVQSTPSWIARAVPADVFRRELERQLAWEARVGEVAPTRACGDINPAGDGTEHGWTTVARPAAGVNSVNWAGTAIACVGLLGIGVFWSLDPGEPPGLDEASSSQPVIRERSETARQPAALNPAAKPGVFGEHEQAEVATRGMRFDLDSDPVGAAVFVGERALGRTPITHWVDQEELPQTVRFERAGYKTVEAKLTRDSSPIVVEILEEQERLESDPPSSREWDEAPADPPQQPRRSKRFRRNKPKVPSGEAAKKKRLSNEHIEQVMKQYLAD